MEMKHEYIKLSIWQTKISKLKTSQSNIFARFNKKDTETDPC